MVGSEDEAAVQQIQSWLQAAGVRWGLDGKHRLAWGLPDGAPDLAHNTWAFGLRRLLLGYAMGPVAGGHDMGGDAVWQGTLAQPALSGLDADLAGGLLDWISATEQTLPALQADIAATQSAPWSRETLAWQESAPAAGASQASGRTFPPWTGRALLASANSLLTAPSNAGSTIRSIAVIAIALADSTMVALCGIRTNSPVVSSVLSGITATRTPSPRG